MTDTADKGGPKKDGPHKDASDKHASLDMQAALQNLYKSLEDVTLTDLPEDQRLRTVELRGRIYNQLQKLRAAPIKERDKAYAELQKDLGGAVDDLKALRDWLDGFHKKFAWAGRISGAITDVLTFL